MTEQGGSHPKYIVSISDPPQNFRDKTTFHQFPSITLPALCVWGGGEEHIYFLTGISKTLY